MIDFRDATRLVVRSIMVFAILVCPCYAEQFLTLPTDAGPFEVYQYVCTQENIDRGWPTYPKCQNPDGSWYCCGSHDGTDYMNELGDPVYAAAGGVVHYYAQLDENNDPVAGGYGYCIDIDHGNGYWTRYAHLSERLVPEGEPIERGQIIGKAGNSGAPWGDDDDYTYHLHFEVRAGGQLGDPKDPYASTDWLWLHNPPQHHSGDTYSCSYVSQSISPAGPYVPGEILSLEVVFKNEGTATWSKVPGAGYVELASCNEVGVAGFSFFNYPCDENNPGLDEWENCQVPCTFDEPSVPPGGVATFTFRGKITEDPELATPGTHLVYFGPFYNGTVIPGWGQMHYPVEVKATGVWLASHPLSNNCNGPLVNGRWWYDEFFDESNWTQVTLPVTNFGCDTCDRFFRYRYNYENQNKTVKVYFASDDGLTLYINGLYIGSWGRGCHGSSCVNNVPWSCAIRANVPAIDITTFLHPRYNQIAVHVTEAGGNEYFNFSFIEEDLSTQLTGACCLGETCVELGDDYTAVNCIADGGQIYSGLQYDCGQHSPCVNKGSKIVSDPVLFFETSLPLPTLPAQLEFSIIDTLARTAYYILPEELGGQTIYISDFSGAFTVTATPSSDPDTVNLTVDEYNFVGASVNFNGIETGSNYVYLDPSSTMETNGYFAYSSGRIELVVPSIIVNDIFPEENPILSRSHVRGTFDLGAGLVTAGSEGYNVIPTGCCMGRVGDANGIGGDEPTIGDVSTMIDALFISGDPEVIACLPEADVNQSGGSDPQPSDITIGDVSTLIDYLFITGPSLGLAECL